MSDKSDDDQGFDPNDDLYDYDDILEENFEDDLDSLDDIQDSEMDYASVELDPENDFEEFEDLEGWDTDKVDELGAGAAPKKKKHLDLSFNAMAIIAALVIGVFVLGYQLMTSKPPEAVDMFFSSLRLAGASDGPVFGDGGIETETLDPEGNIESEEGKGFLYEPETLNSMEMDMELDIEDAPPMPIPLELDEEEIVAEEEPLTPLPGGLADLYGGDPDRQVPRPPDDAEEEEVAEPQVPENTVEQAASEAEGFLKNILKKKEKELVDNAAVKLEVEETQPEPEASAPEEAIRQSENEIPAPVEEPKGALPFEFEDLEEMPAQKMETQQEMAEPPVNVTLAETMSPAVENKLDVILDRLDDMESEIDQIRQSGNSDISDISGDIAALKREMNALDNRPQDSRAEEPKKVVSAPPKTQASAPVKKAPVQKKAAPTASSKIVWELRAAQPGKAWVSPKGESSRMQPVVVGDNLPGIGLITSISFDGARWVVQGTTGRINQ